MASCDHSAPLSLAFWPFLMRGVCHANPRTPLRLAPLRLSTWRGYPEVARKRPEAPIYSFWVVFEITGADALSRRAVSCRCLSLLDSPNSAGVGVGRARAVSLPGVLFRLVAENTACGMLSIWAWFNSLFPMVGNAPQIPTTIFFILGSPASCTKRRWQTSVDRNTMSDPMPRVNVLLQRGHSSSSCGGDEILCRWSHPTFSEAGKRKPFLVGNFSKACASGAATGTASATTVTTLAAYFCYTAIPQYTWWMVRGWTTWSAVCMYGIIRYSARFFYFFFCCKCLKNCLFMLSCQFLFTCRIRAQ